MTPVDPSDALAAALDVAAGRESARAGGAAASGMTPELLAFARRLVAHGRVIAADAGCPKPLVRRAEALFAPRRTGVGAAIWALLFDSASSLTPATRGVVHARFLRIGGDGGAIEAELTGIGTDDVRLMGALNVGEIGKSKATVVLEPSKGAAVRAPVGDGGTFDLRVPSSAKTFTLSVRVGRRVVARSPRLDVASR